MPCATALSVALCLGIDRDLLVDQLCEGEVRVDEPPPPAASRRRRRTDSPQWELDCSTRRLAPSGSRSTPAVRRLRRSFDRSAGLRPQLRAGPCSSPLPPSCSSQRRRLRRRLRPAPPHPRWSSRPAQPKRGARCPPPSLRRQPRACHRQAKQEPRSSRLRRTGSRWQCLWTRPQMSLRHPSPQSDPWSRPPRRAHQATHLPQSPGVPLRLCLGFLDLTLLTLEGADLRGSPLQRDLELAGHVREGVDVIGDGPDLLHRPHAEAVQRRYSSLELASRRDIPRDRFVEALNGTLP